MEGETLRALYEKSFQELLTFMTENLTPKMLLLECNYIAQVCILTISHQKKKNDISFF